MGLIFRQWLARSLLLPLLVASIASTALAAEYDPLNITASLPREGVRWLDLSFLDERRSRELPIRVYFPVATKPAAVVLFSHGLGGSREGNAYLGQHWAARGYLAVHTQHPDSDDTIWKDLPREQRVPALRQAANVQTFLARVADVSAVLDQLARWNKVPGHDLYGRVDLARVGMSGHSYGALTTQALTGQQFPSAEQLQEKRIKAAVIMSPSAPRRGMDAKTAFAAIQLPWLLMTGTKDTFVIGGATIEDRRAVFPALPAGNKYELVLDKAEHSAFGERGLPGDIEPRNPKHHRSILATSTAFWDAYLLEKSDARRWLDADGVRNVIDFADGWQRK